MRRSTPVACVAAALVAAWALAMTLAATGCSRATQGQAGASTGPAAPDPAESAKLLSPTRFDGGAAGFAIQPPVGWAVDSPRQLGTDVRFVNPRPDQANGAAFPANITVATPGGSGTVDDLVAALTRQLPKQFPDLQFTSHEPVTTASGLQARLLGSTFSQGGQRLRDLRLVAVGPGVGYVATGTALESNFGAHEPAIRASLLSLATTG